MYWLRKKLRKLRESWNMSAEEKYLAESTDMVDLENRMKRLRTGSINKNHPFYYL